jgi:hypothetical protein
LFVLIPNLTVDSQSFYVSSFDEYRDLESCVVLLAVTAVTLHSSELVCNQDVLMEIYQGAIDDRFPPALTI